MSNEVVDGMCDWVFLNGRKKTSEMVAKQQQHMKEKTHRDKQRKNGGGKLTSPRCLLSGS